ncbi:MAG: activator of HSP90 ATPase [Cyclobacteriaceae bacterium]|jgi:activator of HSP90 ATPase
MEFTCSTILPAAVDKVYETFLNSDLHAAMTGGKASISNEVGSTFKTWDGYIWGKNLELRPHSYIKQTWKTSDFLDEQEFSVVEFSFEQTNAGTVLTIHHSQLTAADAHYKAGWEDHYFKPMKAYFSPDK